MKPGAALANGLWLASGLPAWRAFRQALSDPAGEQERWLRRHLERNASSAFGRAHGLDRVRTYGDLARAVPPTDWDALTPWIDRIKQGEPRVLTVDPVTHLIPTSGSSGARKLIPFTAGLQRDFDRAIGPWLVDLALTHPQIVGGPAYWCLTPPVAQSAGETSAVPIGFGDDANYLGGVKSWLVRKALISPQPVAPTASLEEFQFQTLLALVSEPDLRLISVWHPSFLELLLDALPRHWESLLQKVPKSRGLAAVAPTDIARVWPKLTAISCWGDAHASLAMESLRRRVPRVALQPKGLLATEAVVTLPFQGLHPLAIRSHFFEFIDDAGSIHLASDLKVGHAYEVMVTTSGGLWRYRLGDRVRVSGKVGGTPSLEFVGRGAAVSDLCGEKLSEGFVAGAIRRAGAETGSQLQFAMLAPGESEPRYRLFWEGTAGAGLDERLDALLRENPHYDLCRRLGQLLPLGSRRLVSAYPRWVDYEMGRGKRLGDIKPVALLNDPHWLGETGKTEEPPLVDCMEND